MMMLEQNSCLETTDLKQSHKSTNEYLNHKNNLQNFFNLFQAQDRLERDYLKFKSGRNQIQSKSVKNTRYQIKQKERGRVLKIGKKEYRGRHQIKYNLLKYYKKEIKFQKEGYKHQIQLSKKRLESQFKYYFEIQTLNRHRSEIKRNYPIILYINQY
ncbi:hypothetical protein TTHERM_000071027 (macronuclear) [Tetrahymena thermophila SB210]|uniref:Uncharacterized protein n=1 Tax=Tetrahymena thermophila (strain SB210) TaxID=312017 RepID=W7XH34_TETTS|nr:hypothetical protein TTHERM_000071027 [Tetrahymena thermophila SB210]EWS76443.1 hypothetical protein TTHERM_000071027 [Tetrahymena thermophila SB210]|eukprot:XP_012651020.1 hypothetical protein TTHERM_000071027 [Tetrahymena thermophila SB210]